MLHQKRMDQLAKLLVLRDHHPMILTRQLYKLRTRNLRVSKLAMGDRHIHIGGALQNERRTTNTFERQFQNGRPLRNVVVVTGGAARERYK